MSLKSLLLFILVVFSLFLTHSTTQAQGNNYQYLLDSVREGKTYALYKAKGNEKKTFTENEGYYIKLVPAKYRIVYDTIELSPALNGNLDTSNYFIQTEVLELKEAGAEWHTARVSSACVSDGKNQPQVSLCLLKTVPKYKIVNRKFFPFKNILDTTNTDYIIPAKTIIVEREVMVESARLERLPLSQSPNLKLGEKVVRVDAGAWLPWEEVVCPYGVFNTPDIRSIQEALKKEGYKIEITNAYDEQTKRAVHEFQRDQMIEEGELDEKTIERLGVRREKLITVE